MHDELTQEVRKLRRLIQVALIGGAFVVLVIWAPRLLPWIAVALAVVCGLIAFIVAIAGVRMVLDPIGRATDRIEQATEFRTVIRGREVRVSIWAWLVLAVVVGSIVLSMR